MPKELVFFDIETTGLEPAASEILEIAAQITDVDGNNIGNHFESLIKPRGPIPLKISRITNIDAALVKDAPDLHTVANIFVEYIGNRPLVGHNSKTFDRKFLNYHFPRADSKAPDQEYLDTLELAYMVFPIRNSLSESSLVKDLLGDVEIHRAWSDTEFLIRLYRELKRHLHEKPETWHYHFSQWADIVRWDWSFLLKRPSTTNMQRKLEFYKPVVNITSEDETGFDEAPLFIDKEKVEASFNEDDLIGIIKGENYRPRLRQVQMALEITDTINNGKHQAIEAGTGLGKSFAYLVPLIEYSKINSEPVVVSTHTRLLQDQLKLDLENIQTHIDIDFSILKGLSNYLCMKKWIGLEQENFDNLPLLSETGEEAVFARLMPMFLDNWRWHTRNGDYGGEIPFRIQADLPKRWEKYISIGEDCPGKSCGHYKNCFAYAARQEARNKNIIITNHALTLRNHLGNGGLLPPHRVLVMDEAHHLDQVAIEELTLEFDRNKLEETLDSIGDGKKGDLGKLGAFLSDPGKSDLATQELAKAKEAVKNSILILFSQDLVGWINQHLEEDEGAIDTYPTKSMLVNEAVRKEKAWPGVLERLNKLLEDIGVLVDRLTYYLNATTQNVEDMEEETAFAAKRIGNLRNSLDEATRLLRAFSEGRPEDVCYFEVWSPDGSKYYLRLRVSPLNAAKALSSELYEQKHSICFVSATIGASSKNRPLMPMMIRTGWNLLPRIDSWKPFKIFKSTFDYKKCMKIDVCNPGAEYNYESDRGKAFFEAVNRKLPELLIGLGGRTLVLCTAHSHIDRLFDMTEKALEAQNIAVYRQRKNESTRVVVEKFKEDVSSCLFGTLGVWEGLDVPGESLSHVVIVKMPYEHPDNPMTKARMERFDVFSALIPPEEKRGVNKLNHYYYPLMLIKLRQGAGRLIRHETDRGELIFLDTRIKSSNNGAFWTYIQNSFFGRPDDIQELLF